MISDVLFEAMTDIRQYQEDAVFRVMYEPLRVEIDAVVAAMEALRIKLDTPPTDIEIAKWRKGDR